MIEFRDQHGKAIGSDAFTAAVKGGQHYVTQKDMEAGKIVLKLLPPGVNAPGSMSFADMTQSSSAQIESHGEHYAVVFHDVHGKPIDREQFVADSQKGQRFTRVLDKHTHRAILTLLPLGVNKPGSQPTSIFVLASQMAAPIPKPGTPFPSLDLPRVGGGRIDTASLKGQPYVVDFFFADCIGCIAELPLLNAYHAKHPDQRVFALTFDDAKIAAGFVKQRKFDWPVAYDGKAFTDKLGIKVYPTMVVVGADGTVLATRIGADDSLTPAKLEQWVADSLHPTHASSAPN